MRSFGKPALLLALVAILALVIPAAASASKIEKSSGVLAKVGEKITTSGQNVVFTHSSAGKTECAKLTDRASVTKNDGTTFETVASGEFTSMECYLFPIKALKISNLTSTTSGTGNAAIYIVRQEAGHDCTYTGTVPFSYSLGSNKISIYGWLKGGGCGNTLISGTFAITINGSSTLPILN